MTKKVAVSTPAKIADEILRSFGPPPLLTISDIVMYISIVEGLAEDEKPRTFIGRILIRDVADLVYQRLWLGNLGTEIIRHVHAENIRRYAAHVKDEAADRKRRLREKNCKPNTATSDGTDSDADNALKAGIEKIDAETGQTIIKLSEAINGPVDEAALFSDWIEKYERVQSLLDAVNKKFKDTLKLLDEYRHGLGQRVRQVADEIVDAEFEEGALRASEQQVATPSSSIAAVEAPVPSTHAMLPRPAVQPLGSPVGISASSRPVSLRERRRLHRAGVQRRRRSALSSPGTRAIEFHEFG